MTYINDAKNGEGWEIQELFTSEQFSQVGKIGWHKAESFPDTYNTKIEAQAILKRRLKGDKELRVYEALKRI